MKLTAASSYVPETSTPGVRGATSSLVLGAVCLVVLSPASIIAQDTPPASPEAPASETFTPAEYPIDRYQKLRGKSPFEFELAKPVVEAAADPFADLVLAGYAGSASRPTVYVVNTKTQERLTILPDGGGNKDRTGYKVLSVNRGRNLATTTVKIEKDGVQKELAFDPKTLSSMTAGATGGQPGGAPGGARPGLPIQPGQPGFVPPGARPGLPGQQPAVKFVAPQAFIPGQSNRAGGAANGQQLAGNPAAGGQAPAAFVPGQQNNAANGMPPGSVMQNQGSQNQPVTTENTVRSLEQQQQINAVLDGKIPPAQQPRRRVVLPTTTP